MQMKHKQRRPSTLYKMYTHPLHVYDWTFSVFYTKSTLFA